MIASNGSSTESIPGESRLHAMMSYGEILETDVDQPKPLVAGLIDEGTGCILAGPPNVGKSWLTVDLARAIASGRPWLDHFPTTQGTVLIFDEESHLPGVKARAEMFERAEPMGSALPLYFAIGHGVRLDTQDGASHLEQQIRSFRPALVILDSFTRIHGVSENDAGELASVFAIPKALMRTYGVTFLFTDHIRKKSLINDAEEMLRGSTEKRAWPDSILFAAPGDAGKIQIAHVKSRYGKRLPDFAVELHVDEEAGTACLSHAGAVATSSVAKANDIVAGIHALKAELGDDGADATRVAAWLECSPDTVRRHAKRLTDASILGVRKVVPSDRGGKPKEVYDVLGGRE